MTKILVSRGYGAGWSTWCHEGNDIAKKIAEYKPIIDFIENGGDPNKLDQGLDHQHPLIELMCKQLELDSFYTGGADGLEIVHVDGPYRIDEYDGYESVTTAEDFW